MASGKRAFYHSRLFQLLVGGAVTVACLALAWWQMSQGGGGKNAFEEMKRAFRSANYNWLPAMLLSIVLFYWIKAWRWSLLLRPIRSCSIWEVTPAMMIGFAFNNILPGHAGEFVRVVVFSRNNKFPWTAVLSTVALERVLDILAILALLGVGLALVDIPSNDVRSLAWGFAAVAALGVGGALLYLFWTKPFVSFVEAILARMKFLPSGFSKKVAELMEAGASGLAALKDPKLVGLLVITSLGQWILNAVLVHLSLLSFGLDVSFLVSFVVMGVVAFAVTIPSSPGYFGVIQYAFGMSAGVFVTKELVPAVFAASVYYHLVQWIPVTLIGLILFQRSGLSMKAVDEEASHLGEELEAVEPEKAREEAPGPVSL